MAVLEVLGLCKRFGEKQVLSDLSFSVGEHSIFGFIGKNGAGKTTTMKAILGLLRPDSGQIRVLGERVQYGEAPTNRHIGYLPDVPAFYPYMSAPEYLTFCGQITGLEHKEIRARVPALLERVGLAGEGHRIGGFSRGMKQRLGIASALIHRPRLLICDEPTSALDPIGRSEILDVLLAVKEEATVIFSTHILADVERIATDIALLDGGKIRLAGALPEIKALHRRDEYRLVLENATDAALLLSAFPAMRRDGAALDFCAEECDPAAVLSLLAERRIPFLGLTRAEPTLETLFCEVVRT